MEAEHGSRGGCLPVSAAPLPQIDQDSGVPAAGRRQRRAGPGGERGGGCRCISGAATPSLFGHLPSSPMNRPPPPPPHGERALHLLQRRQQSRASQIPLLQQGKSIPASLFPILYISVYFFFKFHNGSVSLYAWRCLVLLVYFLQMIGV